MLMVFISTSESVVFLSTQSICVSLSLFFLIHYSGGFQDDLKFDFDLFSHVEIKKVSNVKLRAFK